MFNRFSVGDIIRKLEDFKQENVRTLLDAPRMKAGWIDAANRILFVATEPNYTFTPKQLAEAVKAAAVLDNLFGHHQVDKNNFLFLRFVLAMTDALVMAEENKAYNEVLALIFIGCAVYGLVSEKTLELANQTMLEVISEGKKEWNQAKTSVSQSIDSFSNYVSDLWQSLPEESELDKELAEFTPSFTPHRLM